MSSIDQYQSVLNSSFTEIAKGQKHKGNLVRANLERYRSRMPPPLPKEDMEDDAMTTRSVISTISNQGKLETINQYKLIKIIGQGSFAKVYLAKDSTNGERRAIKMLDKKLSGWKLLGKTTALDAATKETAIMKKLKHPNVGKSNQW